jgi:long-subunit acyl-CoA synthetase (AMP-forming)
MQTSAQQKVLEQVISPIEAFYQNEKRRRTPYCITDKYDETHPQSLCFTQPWPDGSTTEYTWQEVGNEVRRMATYLISLSYPAGSKIALMSSNCAHWIMADLAIWMAGHISVPLYPVLNTKTVGQILAHSDAKLIFLGKLESWESIDAGIPDDLVRVTLPICPEPAKASAVQWQDIIAANEPLIADPIPQLEDIATIIYTSGTTGMPKGVMHSHRNLGAVASLVKLMYEISANDRMLSYLPLAHVAERAAVELCQLYSGFPVWFANNLTTFGEDLRRAQPTLFFAVPRIWTKFQQQVLAQIPAKKLNLMLKLPIVKNIVSKKLLTAMGLNSVQAAISGAAPISTSLLEWYKKLGIEILEGYAMSENMAYSHATRRGDSLIGFVGLPSPLVDCKIDPDSGEILVKSPCNMIGYFKEPGLTAEAINGEGYLHTGDKGEIDATGRLKITGRIKEIFKTSKGKYVAPSPIENKLLSNSSIEQICVAGADLTQPLALLVLAESVNASDASVKTEITKELGELITSVNQSLDHHENIKCIVIASEPWTTENNLMTPTLKIKRAEIDAAYGDKYETWLSAKDTVIWL